MRRPNALVRFNQRVMSYSLSLATLVLTLGLFPSETQAGIFDCIGPPETMEDTNWNSQGGTLVPLSHWSPVEQTFLKEYTRRFYQDCMGFEPPEVDEAETMYGQEGYDDLLERVRRICQKDTGGYGTNWDNFVRRLASFPAVCQL